jgi:hypothetical protein
VVVCVCRDRMCDFHPHQHSQPATLPPALEAPPISEATKVGLSP